MKEDSEDKHLLFILKMGLLKKQSKNIPDTDQQWKNFVAKKTTKSHKRLYIWQAIAITAAACTITAIFTLFLVKKNTEIQQEMVFQSNSASQEIIVRTGNGENIILPAKCSKVQMDSILQHHDIDEKEMISVITPRKKSISITLPDGSTAWLNAESQLSYNMSFDKERVVKMRGEAYFKVNKNEGKDFVVIAEHISTKVYGTEFNMRCYSPSDTHVTLVNGSVQVKNNNNNNAQYLVPGEDAELTPDGTFNVSNIDLNEFISWKDGFFYYDNVSIENILKDLGRWYNVSVVIDNKQISRQHLRFQADRNASVEDAVRLLNMLGVCHAEYHNNCIFVK